jgi:hypothetical protein
LMLWAVYFAYRRIILVRKPGVPVTPETENG